MLLKGKRGLIVGIANCGSIAYGCAKVLHGAGAELAVTYLGCSIVVPCDVRQPGQLEAVFARVRDEWGHLDFLLHSIAYAPKEDLRSRITDCSQAGFAMAMDVSCHSFIRMARLAEPLMTDGGCLLTVTFYGAEKVVEEYNLMGPVKAALKSCVRIWRPNSGRSGFASMNYLPVPSGRARHRESRASTNCWNTPGPARPSTVS